jgi:hypothetical protein
MASITKISAFFFPVVPLLFLGFAEPAAASPLTIAGQPAVLKVRAAGESSIRVTLKPESFKAEFPAGPVLPEKDYPRPALTLRDVKKPVTATVAGLVVTVRPEPLRLTVTGNDGTVIQSLTFQADGSVDFMLDDQPVLGMGEGGPKMTADWRAAPVEFDRRGRLHEMTPEWQRGAYGSRNPVALLVGTRGWGLFFATPWGHFDLREQRGGRFIPIEVKDATAMRQNFANQGKQLGKGLPPSRKFS